MTDLRLKNGEVLHIDIALPPFGPHAERIGGWCWNDIRDELVSGALADQLYTPYFVGSINGQSIGSIGLFTGCNNPQVGLVEFVLTDEAHRRKGVSSALLHQLIQHFCQRGGLALYLCTANPHAGTLYEQQGFCYTVGDGMRYLAPEAADFERTYFTDSGPATPRPATWSDLPGTAALYNHPEPNWYIKEYLSACFHDTRFESHFVKLMRRLEEGRGAIIALETPQKRLVGTAFLERCPNFYQQHLATLSFRACPAYFAQVPALLEATVERARQLDIAQIQTYIAANDQDQIALVEAVGFKRTACLQRYLADENGSRDLLVYILESAATITQPNDRGAYYGGRKPWQQDRLNLSR